MSHHLKIEAKPDRNKDGSPSKTKKIYRIVDRTRRGRVILDEVHSKTEARQAFLDGRLNIINRHLKKHPNDLAFKRKHGVE